MKIYHNPRCSKSRAAMQLLNDRGIDPEIIDYLTNPPSEEELREVLHKLNIQPRDLIRFNESVAKELKLSAADERPAQDWIKLMVDNPILIERPIVVNGDKAAIGRPPEDVLNIL